MGDHERRDETVTIPTEGEDLGVVRDWDAIVSRGSLSDVLREIVLHTALWREDKGFSTGWSNFAEKLMLVVTEIDESRQACDNVMGHMKAIVSPGVGPGLGVATMPYHAEKASSWVFNLAEEWTDVTVRLFDIVGSCLFGVLVERLDCDCNPLPFFHDGALYNADIFSGRISIDIAPIISDVLPTLRDRCISGLSQAMEFYRDVPSSGEASVATKDKLLDALMTSVGASVLAVEYLGFDWKRQYAQKMKINEKRQRKHGRQR